MYYSSGIYPFLASSIAGESSYLFPEDGYYHHSGIYKFYSKNIFCTVYP